MAWVEWLGAAVRHPVTAVTVGSALGGNARYWLGKLIHAQQWPGGLPWWTIVINISGSFLLGFFAIWLKREEPIYPTLLLLLGTGFCGGYTTFSTFELDTYNALLQGKWLAALANVLGSVLLGFLGLVLGIALAHGVFERSG